MNFLQRSPNSLHTQTTKKKKSNDVNAPWVWKSAGRNKTQACLFSLLFSLASVPKPKPSSMLKNRCGFIVFSDNVANF